MRFSFNFILKLFLLLSFFLLCSRRFLCFCKILCIIKFLSISSLGNFARNMDIENCMFSGFYWMCKTLCSFDENWFFCDWAIGLICRVGSVLVTSYAEMSKNLREDLLQWLFVYFNSKWLKSRSVSDFLLSKGYNSTETSLIFTSWQFDSQETRLN